jgi:hypothetical protein
MYRGEMMKKILTTAVLLGAIFVMGQGSAFADEVNVAGYTGGVFASTSSNQLMGLTYDSSNFDVTTVLGFAGIGSAPGIPNFNNLGSFTLATSPGSPTAYTGQSFQLTITFTLPTVISGGPTLVTAALIGTVFDEAGGVRVNFSNAPQTIYFTNAIASGSFNITVNDVSITPGGTVAATGYVSGAQQGPTINSVPEPVTVFLLGIGMIGVGFAGRFQYRKGPR